MNRAVDPGLAVGLHDQQQVGAGQEAPDLLRQLPEVAQTFEDAGVRAAQDTEARAVDNFHMRVLAAADIVQLAIAEEGEVIVFDPAQEIDDFADFLPVMRGVACADLGHDVEHLLPHRPPVLDGSSHIVEHRMQLGLDIGKNLGRALLGDAQLHE